MYCSTVTASAKPLYCTDCLEKSVHSFKFELHPCKVSVYIIMHCATEYTNTSVTECL